MIRGPVRCGGTWLQRAGRKEMMQANCRRLMLQSTQTVAISWRGCAKRNCISADKKMQTPWRPGRVCYNLRRKQPNCRPKSLARCKMVRPLWTLQCRGSRRQWKAALPRSKPRWTRQNNAAALLLLTWQWVAGVFIIIKLKVYVTHFCRQTSFLTGGISTGCRKSKRQQQIFEKSLKRCLQTRARRCGPMSEWKKDFPTMSGLALISHWTGAHAFCGNMGTRTSLCLNAAPKLLRRWPHCRPRIFRAGHQVLFSRF